MSDQPSTQQLSPQGFGFKDPVDLLAFVDPDTASKLHKWQIQFMLDFADERNTKDFPFQAELQTCNGSGKDKFIVAICAVWLILRYVYSRAVVTNGSGVQLDNQTEHYIDLFAKSFNSKLGTEIIKCNYRYYECMVTHSPITLFATDEANKAEGFHPLIPGGKMAIFASEAKSIPDEIFAALSRCTGYTHKIDVSSPGLPMGYFYDRCAVAIPRSSITDIKSIDPTCCLHWKITAYDCPHITQVEIENFANGLAGGKNNSVFKSGILAEFGTTDEMVVIPSGYVWKAINDDKRKWLKEPFNTAGLDLSDGGDETVLTIRNGNKHLATIPFRFDNTEDTIAFLNDKFKEWELNKSEATINADCGGLGKPMLDRMKRQGWSNIRYVDNRHKARYPRTYLNMGTELWFHVRLLLERAELIIQRDKTLVQQLSTRFYKIDVNNRHQLLSKLESRSRGYPSPDRGDSFVLAFWDYKSTYTEQVIKEVPFESPVDEISNSKELVGDFDMKSWAEGNRGKPIITRVDTSDLSDIQDEISAYNKVNRLTTQPN